jgi:hypothetical protein
MSSIEIEEREMYIRKWYKMRGARFVLHRSSILLQRYGVTATKNIHRIGECTEALAELGYGPTFFTPGILVERYPHFIQGLQENGAEIAVHSYQHINLDLLSISEAEQQLIKAINIFSRYGVENHGFRCPYLGYREEMLAALPNGMFDYSSNEAILCDLGSQYDTSHKSLFFNTLEKFYKGGNFSENPCLPFMRSNMVEIPICVPDDLQLHDGLLLDEEGITQVWARMLEQTYVRGELFTLIFHTELASFHSGSFTRLIMRAREYQPSVWIARLQDISDWWREKSKFKVDITSNLNELKLTFDCSPRATILVRGLDLHNSGLKWDGVYVKLQSNTLEVPANPRPFIGIADGIPEDIVSFLQEQGYILNIDDTASSCGLILNNEILNNLSNNVELVNFIESSTTPLVRYWRWPNGAKSAMSITGDLDALSLWDYATRLFT